MKRLLVLAAISALLGLTNGKEFALMTSLGMKPIDALITATERVFFVMKEGKTEDEASGVEVRKSREDRSRRRLRVVRLEMFPLTVTIAPSGKFVKAPPIALALVRLSSGKVR